MSSQPHGAVSPQSTSQNQLLNLLPIKYVVTSMKIVAGVLSYSELYSFRYILRNGMAGLYGNSIFGVLKSLYSDFHNIYKSLYLQPAGLKVPLSLHLSQHLWSLVFLMIAIMMAVRWILNVVFL